MTRVRAVAPLVVATVLAGVAVLTVTHAGCDDPGRYVAESGGYELIGGCLNPDDLVVPAPVTPAPRRAAADDAAPTRS